MHLKNCRVGCILFYNIGCLAIGIGLSYSLALCNAPKAFCRRYMQAKARTTSLERDYSISIISHPVSRSVLCMRVICSWASPFTSTPTPHFKAFLLSAARLILYQWGT